MLTREEREELKMLSTEIFGVSSKYQKFINGQEVILTEEVEETVPGEEGQPDTTRKISVPKLTHDGRKQKVIKMYTFEETKELFLKFKGQKDAFILEQARIQAEAQAAQAQRELEKKVNAELSGTAV